MGIVFWPHREFRVAMQSLVRMLGLKKKIVLRIFHVPAF
jgi:hypothetical protein